MIAFATGHRSQIRPNRQCLRYTPYAWAKLVFLRDVGDTEVGGLGITDVDDPLLVVDVVLLNQRCTAVSCEVEDESLVAHNRAMIGRGQSAYPCSRIWIHTNPNDFAMPGPMDDARFDRLFGQYDWAVMSIVARSGASYSRLQFNVGPRATKRLRTCVDYGSQFRGADHVRWLNEYVRTVQVLDLFVNCGGDPRDRREAMGVAPGSFAQ